MKTNIILNTDSYKASHFLQYPVGAQYVTSYIEARGSDDNEFAKEILFFGLQAFIKEYLLTPITMADINEAEAVFTAHGEPFNREGWEYILNEHKGYLPIKIEAVPEGTVLPLQNVLVQVTNTDPKCPWVTSYIETALLRAIWYPSTVATNSYIIKKKLFAYAVKSGSALEGLPFKLHDFGARGVSSEESAALGGMAHLVNFMGTDTMSGLLAARRYYGADMAGFSIPAAEHSTITSWGEGSEEAAYANMLKQFAKPEKILAVVSDSYDLWNAVDNIWGGSLKQQVIDSGATLVVRPDSGDPTVVPVQTILKLMDKFGYTVNEKGYKVLPSCVRVIQGDGINKDSIQAILDNMDILKLALDNIAFGMGGALLQGVNRDTMKFAMKCNAIVINGREHGVMKNPVTDSGKKSKAGVQDLILTRDGEYKTLPRNLVPLEGGATKVLRTVFETGKNLIKAGSHYVSYVDDTFDEIRERANANLK